MARAVFLFSEQETEIRRIINKRGGVNDLIALTNSMKPLFLFL
jgi:hypothetical protein